MRTASFLIVVACSLLVANEARADSEGRPAPVCDIGTMYPRANTVPANMLAFLVAPTIPGAPPAVRFLRTDTGVATPVPFRTEARGTGLALIPESLVEGESYRFEVPRRCDGSPEVDTLAFSVGPAAPYPTTLGTITATPFRATNNGLPGPKYRTYYVDVSLTLADEMRPWRDVYGVAMVLDEIDPGQGGLPVSGIGVGPGRVFFDCGQQLTGGTLPPGRHSVRYRASVASFDTPIAITNTITIDADCAKAQGDASTLAPPRPEDDESSSSSDWGCAAATRPASGGALAGAMLALALVFFRRSRR